MFYSLEKRLNHENEPNPIAKELGECIDVEMEKVERYLDTSSFTRKFD